MKINVFRTIEESFRYGDLNSSTITNFLNKDDRDKYYDYLLSNNRKNLGLVEYTDSDEKPHNFHDGGKWSYSLDKDMDTIVICEGISINDENKVKLEY